MSDIRLSQSPHPKPEVIFRDSQVSEQIVIHGAFEDVDLGEFPEARIFLFDTPGVPADGQLSEYQMWFCRVLDTIEYWRHRDAALILPCRDRKGHPFLKSVASAALAQSHGWEVFRQFVWLRQSADFHRSRYPYIVIWALRQGSMPVRRESPLRFKDIIRIPDVTSPNESVVGEQPVELVYNLLTLFAAPNTETWVLDPFAGSGSTAMACLELGIPCISIELHPGRAQQIVERLQTRIAELVSQEGTR